MANARFPCRGEKPLLCQALVMGRPHRYYNPGKGRPARNSVDAIHPTAGLDAFHNKPTASHYSASTPETYS